MDILNYILLLCICYAGIISAYILSKIAPEELNPGERYFKITSIILIISILAVFTYYLNFSIFSIVFISIAVYLIIKKKAYSAYPLFAIIIFLSMSSEMILIIEASLIFLAGLFITLEGINKNNSRILRSSLFIFIGILFYILNYYNIIW